MGAARKRLTWCIASALALAVWCVPAAASAPLQLPTSALQNYYLEQRQVRSQSSEALSMALLYTAMRAPEDRRIALAEQAALAAPNRAEPHLLRCRWSLQRFDVAGAVLALRDAWQAAASDAVQSARWTLRLQALVHRTLLGAFLALAIVLLVRSLPFLEHVFSTRSRSPRALVLILVSLVLLGLVSFPLCASLLTLTLLAPFLVRAERSALGLLCLLLAGASFLLQWQRPEMLLADPGHRLHLLARASLETLPPEQVRTLERELPASRERDVVLGLQAARRRQWHQSHQRYVQALAQDSTWATTYVNLANVFFALADYERASTGYRTAQSLAPDSPYPHANLAQAYIQMLQYEQSDHELSMASSLGFETTNDKRMAWIHESQPVVDVTLNRQELRRLAQAEVVQDPAAADEHLTAWLGPGWNGLPHAWVPWLLLSLTAWFWLRLRWSAVAFECAECKRITCRHCVGEADDGVLFCPRCEMLASRRSGHSIGDGTPASRRPSHAQIADKAPDGIAVLFPGAAFLLLRSPALATITMVLACAILSLAHAGVAGALFLSLYLPGLWRLRNKKRIVRV